MDLKHVSAVSGIRRLEREFLIRDFIEALNVAPRSPEGIARMETLLHPDVVYRPTPTHSARGREAVLRVCQEVRTAFDVLKIEIETLAVGHDTARAEHSVQVKLLGGPLHELRGSSSFRFDSDLIREWHQFPA